jgi:hypothetical protein
MASKGSDTADSPYGLEYKPIVIVQSAKTINNQNIRVSILVSVATA